MRRLRSSFAAFDEKAFDGGTSLVTDDCVITDVATGEAVVVRRRQVAQLPVFKSEVFRIPDLPNWLGSTCVPSAGRPG